MWGSPQSTGQEQWGTLVDMPCGAFALRFGHPPTGAGSWQGLCLVAPMPPVIGAPAVCRLVRVHAAVHIATEE